MNKQPKISIIVPVYKAEAYLRRCMDSLLTQTFTDFEVLLIDDGSPDHSGEICDEYAAKDSRVRVIHKENGGAASARQNGIENIRGEYTIHADSDDWVENDMLEKLYAKAQEDNADIVLCDYYLNYPDGKQIVRKQQPTSLAVQDVIHDLFHHLQGSCCNKLVRSSLFQNNNICFEKGIDYGEDIIFNIKLLQLSPKISYLNRPFYHYWRDQKHESYTNNIRLSTFHQMVMGVKWRLEHLDKRKYTQELLNLRLKVAIAGLRAEGMTPNIYRDYIHEYLPTHKLYRNGISLKSLIATISSMPGGFRFGRTFIKLLDTFRYI